MSLHVCLFCLTGELYCAPLFTVHRVFSPSFRVNYGPCHHVTRISTHAHHSDIHTACNIDTVDISMTVIDSSHLPLSLSLFFFLVSLRVFACDHLQLCPRSIRTFVTVHFTLTVVILAAFVKRSSVTAMTTVVTTKMKHFVRSILSLAFYCLHC